MGVKKDTAVSESARREIVGMAEQIIEDERWFRALPAHMKDHLSDPNHNAIQAEKGLALARAVLNA